MWTFWICLIVITDALCILEKVREGENSGDPRLWGAPGKEAHQEPVSQLYSKCIKTGQPSNTYADNSAVLMIF